MARLGSMVVKGKLPVGGDGVREDAGGGGGMVVGWFTYFGSGVGEGVEGGGFAGGGLAHEGDEGIAGHGQ